MRSAIGCIALLIIGGLFGVVTIGVLLPDSRSFEVDDPGVNISRPPQVDDATKRKSVEAITTTLTVDGADHINTFVWRSFDDRPLAVTLHVSIDDAKQSATEWGVPSNFEQELIDETKRAFEREAGEFNARDAQFIDERNRDMHDLFETYRAADAAAIERYNALVSEYGQSQQRVDDAFAETEARRGDLRRTYEAAVADRDVQLAQLRQEAESAYRSRVATIDQNLLDSLRRTRLDGCFREENNTISVDAACVVSRDAQRLNRAALELFRVLGRSYETVEAVQDAALLMCATALEYRIPLDQESGRDTLGLLPPAVCLARGWGDCDSKALLLATLFLAWRTQSNAEIRCIEVVIPGHCLLGVQRTPVAGQAYVEFEGLPYVLMEAAGPAALPTGVLGDATQAFVDGGGRYSLRRIF